MSTTVILADDHTLVREGLRSMLEQNSKVKILGEAGDGLTAVQLALSLRPDIAVMDISMPGLNGIDATAAIVESAPATGIIILSIHQDEHFINGAFMAGARGYLLKESLFDELLQAVRAVKDGQFFISPQVAHVAVNAIKQESNFTPRRPAAILTDRERIILQLLAEGRKVFEVGEQLCISPKTVETHRRNIYEKIQARKPIDLIKYALREGVIDYATWIRQDEASSGQ